MKSNYIWLDDCEKNLQRFKSCFDQNDSSRTLTHLRWQYLDGLQSVAPLVLLGIQNGDDTNSQLTGIYATFQNQFICDGNIVLGIQSLDTLTSKEFRGKGLFNDFAQQVYAKAEQQGISFIYGFPNKNSAYGFFIKLGWTQLDPVPFIIKPLNTSYILSKIPFLKAINKFIPNIRLIPRATSLHNGLKLVENIQIDSRYDDLWLTFRNTFKVGLDRSSKYLQWRLSRPGEQYFNIACLDEEGAIVAICIYTNRDKHGGKIGYIMDLIHRPGVKHEATAVLNTALINLAKKGCDAVLSWCFGHSVNYENYRQSGFFIFPEIIRPIELHFGARAFDACLHREISQRDSWYISYLDSDTV
jgi:hypothetical protein